MKRLYAHPKKLTPSTKRLYAHPKRLTASMKRLYAHMKRLTASTKSSRPTRGGSRYLRAGPRSLPNRFFTRRRGVRGEKGTSSSPPRLRVSA